MVAFSQRIGKTPLNKPFQFEEVDLDLRTRFWNVLYVLLWEPNDEGYYLENSELNNFLKRVWIHFFNKPVDEMSECYSDAIEGIRRFFFDCEWYEVFNFIEFILGENKFSNLEFPRVFNQCLEKENSAYRIVNKQVSEITNENEIEEIENALNRASHDEVRQHLDQALCHLNNKENPDFRNSIKESISAVESLAKKISGKSGATLGDALTEVKKSKNFHPAYEEAFKKLYGWTSDGDGIRHALLKESNLIKADARFMLVACSAFTNYLIDLTKD